MTTSDFGNVSPVKIETEMRSSYLDYAMSVIVSRALPDVRDGLKPVQRRILYAMYDQGMRHNSSYKKSARLVGEVLGKYHPHGDTAVYDAQVRMAQPFSMLHPLVDGQGNYGSVDGDPPAAMRYTECRLSRITDSLLGDIDRETVDWSDNFDQSLKEPTVLPTRLPNLLVNGASGIAVGMATNIPPHNLSELCDGIIHLADNPNASIDELMEFVKGPDFPTGAHIWGKEGIRNVFLTGRGMITVRAEHNVEEASGDRKRIVITEMPYQVNKATFVSAIAELIKKKRIDGAYEVRDESDRKGMRVVIELRRGTSPDVILNNCYRYTDMRKTFAGNMIALVDRVPKVLTLKHALECYVNFRREVVRRRGEFDLKRAKARQHVLAGLLTALEHVDRIIAIIRGSQSVEDARTNLIQEFGLSRIQAQSILDMQLRRFAALEREKIEQEYRDLTEKITGLELLLSTPSRITDVVKDETREIQQAYGQKRRTVIHTEELGEWRREDVEPRKEVVITLSRGGYVKRVDSSIYKAQHRGGKGVRGHSMTKEGDVTPWLQVANTHDRLLFFTSMGRVFVTRAFELPADQSRKSRGTPVRNIINIEPQEEVQSILAVRSLSQDLYLIFATRKGIIKRMHLALIRNIRRGGLASLKIRPGDALLSVGLASETQDVVMVTEQGMSVRFNSASLRPRLSRATGGVKGISIRDDDSVVGMNIVNEDDELLVVTLNGYGKISPLKRYRQQKRGGKGLRTLKITNRNGPIVATAVINPDVRDDSDGKLFLLTERAQVIRTNLSEIRSTGRITQGVRLVTPDQNDRISAIRVLDQRRPEGEELDEESIANMEHASQTKPNEVDDLDESGEEETANLESEPPEYETG